MTEGRLQLERLIEVGITARLHRRVLQVLRVLLAGNLLSSLHVFHYTVLAALSLDHAAWPLQFAQRLGHGPLLRLIVLGGVVVIELLKLLSRFARALELPAHTKLTSGGCLRCKAVVASNWRRLAPIVLRAHPVFEKCCVRFDLKAVIDKVLPSLVDLVIASVRTLGSIALRTLPLEQLREQASIPVPLDRVDKVVPCHVLKLVHLVLKLGDLETHLFCRCLHEHVL